MQNWAIALLVLGRMAGVYTFTLAVGTWVFVSPGAFFVLALTGAAMLIRVDRRGQGFG